MDLGNSFIVHKHLPQNRLARIGFHIKHVDVARIQTGQDELVPRRNIGGILVHQMATGARIPAAVMELIAGGVGEVAMNDLCGIVIFNLIWYSQHHAWKVDFTTVEMISNL